MDGVIRDRWLGFTRELMFSPAWDRRDPDPKKDYGIHGVEMRMHLIGGMGAVQFVVYTNWQLDHIQQMQDKNARTQAAASVLFRPMPADLGYHSLRPHWDDQFGQEQCPLLNMRPCYYDGSGLNAERVFTIFKRDGIDIVWQELHDYYNSIFHREDS